MTNLTQKIIKARRMTITGIAYSREWGEIDSEKDLLVYKNT